MRSLKQIGEFEFIETIATLCRNKKKVIQGIGDDAAVVCFKKDKYLLFTTDMLLEDVHFLRKQRPCDIGHKAIAASISDIAAMGGVPEYALFSIGLPPDLNASFAKGIYQGIKKTARDFDIDIIGGDTNRSKKIIISAFIAGYVERKNLTLRKGAKVGDLIFVTGRLGGSEFGRHLKFTPRVKEARFLVKNYMINSMIDISDGLVQDLGHIIKASKVGAIMYEANIPLSTQAKSIKDAYSQGEDFELLFTLPKKYRRHLMKNWPFKNRPRLSCIGEIVNANAGLKVEDKEGRLKRLKIAGYRHF